MAPHFIVLLCLFLGSSLVTAQSPGTPCDTDPDCSPTITFLTCVRNGATKTCECPDQSHFDKNDGRCHRDRGQTCETLGTSMPCTQNSQCLPANSGMTCQCEADFDPVSDGKKCAKAYGQNCTRDLDCNRDEFQKCDTLGSTPRTCVCDERGWWNTTTSKCDLRENEVCDPEDEVPMARKCARASTCLLANDTQNDRICVCDAGYLVPADSKDGLCYLSPGGSCSGTAADHCDPYDPHGQVCSSAGTCVCKDEDKTVIENGRCKLKVNQVCIQPPIGPQVCESGAICDKYNETCRCMTDGGYHEYNGRCVASFGFPCKSGGTNSCGGVDNNLECIDDICQCHPHYSEVTNPNTVVQCFGNLGAPCTMTNDNCRKDRSLTCQTDSNGTPRCACYVPDEMEYDYTDKQCYSMRGGRCNSATFNGTGHPILCKPGLSCNQQKDAPLPYDGQCSGAAQLLAGLVSFSFLLPAFFIASR